MKYKTYNNRKKNGFTIFEVLVVIFIIGLLSTILIVGMRGGEKKYQLKIAAQEIAQNIRKVQDMALNIREHGSTVYNYGAYFRTSTPTSYILFADTNNNNRYDNGETIETIDMKSGTQIDSISHEPNLYITFSIPDGFTTIRPIGGTATIEIKGNGAVKTIEITESGQISVID